MMSQRSLFLVNQAVLEARDRERLEMLQTHPYESTKGTNVEERSILLASKYL